MVLISVHVKLEGMLRHHRGRVRESLIYEGELDLGFTNVEDREGARIITEAGISLVYSIFKDQKACLEQEMYFKMKSIV